jgi:putative membrane protein
LELGKRLALADAALSAATVLLLVAGYWAIRRRDIRRHRSCMLGAFACSAAFMVLFVIRFVTFGFRPFQGQGGWRAAYYVVLFAHEPIAVLSVPLAVVTLALGLSRARSHRELARPTALLWGISAVTGTWLYVMLYVASL